MSSSSCSVLFFPNFYLLEIEIFDSYGTCNDIIWFNFFLLGLCYLGELYSSPTSRSLLLLFSGVEFYYATVESPGGSLSLLVSSLGLPSKFLIVIPYGIVNGSEGFEFKEALGFDNLFIRFEGSDDFFESSTLSIDDRFFNLMAIF